MSEFSSAFSGESQRSFEQESDTLTFTYMRHHLDSDIKGELEVGRPKAGGPFKSSLSENQISG